MWRVMILALGGLPACCVLGAGVGGNFPIEREFPAERAAAIPAGAPVSAKEGRSDVPIDARFVGVRGDDLLLRSDDDKEDFAVRLSRVHGLRATTGSYWLAGFLVGAAIDAVVVGLVAVRLEQPIMDMSGLRL